MASQTKTLGMLLMLLLLSPLAYLAISLWKHDYRVDSSTHPDDASDVTLRPVPGGEANVTASLRPKAAVWPRASLNDPKNPQMIFLELTNTGRTPARILDAQLPSPLVQMEVEYLGPDGNAKPVPVRPAVARPGLGVPPMNPLSNFVDLLPGHALILPVPASEMFDFKREGRYRIKAFYDSQAFATSFSVNLIQMGLMGMRREAQATEITVVATLEPSPPPEATAVPPVPSP
ncbi:MAG: hypothetical protein AMXMBFR7_22640 [Planctomycetota bacterium]